MFRGWWKGQESHGEHDWILDCSSRRSTCSHHSFNACRRGRGRVARCIPPPGKAADEQLNTQAVCKNRRSVLTEWASVYGRRALLVRLHSLHAIDLTEESSVPFTLRCTGGPSCTPSLSRKAAFRQRYTWCSPFRWNFIVRGPRKCRDEGIHLSKDIRSSRSIPIARYRNPHLDLAVFIRHGTSVALQCLGYELAGFDGLAVRCNVCCQLLSPAANAF